MKKALITGIAGQDGSYLAELLLEKGYEVHGIVHEKNVYSTQIKYWRIEHMLSTLTLHTADVRNYKAIYTIVAEIMPHEIYDLAAVVDPGLSFETEFTILHTNMEGIHNLLAAARVLVPQCHIYFAASSLVFGEPSNSPQNEHTPMNPVTPYGIAKVVGCSLVRMYRKNYGMFAVSGILYNHESPRRDFHFLPRKITSTAVKIKYGLMNELRLGDINAKRDWGFAGDFVRSMWLMLQTDMAEDYVIGTGTVHSVRDLLELSFGFLKLDWRKYVVIDEKLVRSAEPMVLVANSRKARENLGWTPTVSFEELVKKMLDTDIKEREHKGL